MRSARLSGSCVFQNGGKIDSSRSSEKENSNSGYSFSNESDPISEAKNLNRANLSKPETDAALEIARKPKEKKKILSKDLKGFSTQGVLFHTIPTDLGSAQTVRGNKVYSISITSRERLMRKTFSSSLTPGVESEEVQRRQHQHNIL